MCEWGVPVGSDWQGGEPNDSSLHQFWCVPAWWWWWCAMPCLRVDVAATNTNLDPLNFTPFGVISEADMKVVDAIYAGYGQVCHL
jgi:hypothetical protein